MGLTVAAGTQRLKWRPERKIREKVSCMMTFWRFDDGL